MAGRRKAGNPAVEPPPTVPQSVAAEPASTGNPVAGLPDKPTYLVSEVAYYYGCAEQTVRLWIDHRKLDAVYTPGGQRRITRESLIRCILTRNGHVSG